MHFLKLASHLRGTRPLSEVLHFPEGSLKDLPANQPFAVSNCSGLGNPDRQRYKDSAGGIYTIYSATGAENRVRESHVSHIIM